MSTLSNLSFTSLYNFTNPQLSLGFIAIVNIFLISPLFCFGHDHDHDHGLSIFYVIAKYIWFATILLVGYVKFNALKNQSQNLPAAPESLVVTPSINCTSCIPDLLKKLNDNNNVAAIFGGLLLLNIFEGIFGATFTLFLAFNLAFTFRYLKLKGIVKEGNYKEKITAALTNIFNKIPRYQRSI